MGVDVYDLQGGVIVAPGCRGLHAYLMRAAGSFCINTHSDYQRICILGGVRMKMSATKSCWIRNKPAVCSIMSSAANLPASPTLAN